MVRSLGKAVLQTTTTNKLMVQEEGKRRKRTREDQFNGSRKRLRGAMTRRGQNFEEIARGRQDLEITGTRAPNKGTATPRNS